ncbi:MAG: hypothetical protein C5B50_16220 [Verrucomicrobia bacterium]|nr:MAG: hypothetical protein C5B50_16220 [Verrucomicrobiota bacterium]
MDAILSRLRASRLAKESRRITAVAAYEDSVTDARVNHFCRALSKEKGRHCEIVRQMWLLNELRMPPLRAVAAVEAAAADLVIVSLHHCEDLPEAIKNWIELSLQKKGRRPALLLALIDPVHEGDSGEICSFLEKAASKAGIEFLVGNVEHEAVDHR